MDLIIIITLFMYYFNFKVNSIIYPIPWIQSIELQFIFNNSIKSNNNFVNYKAYI